MKACVINFLGSNCVDETAQSLLKAGFFVDIINQNETNLERYNLIVLPGGFSWGDYVSCGRIAKFSPVISAIKEKIKQKNSFILGICNGFQILCEANILLGALLENENQKFISRDVDLIFKNKTFKLPIAHHQGRYYIGDVDKLKDCDLIKYQNNPNGSYCDIAGLYDKKNKVMGLMPHPERNYITPFKGEDGKIIFDFIKEELK